VNPTAEVAWIAELQRRQERHSREVRRLIQQHPNATLVYGDGRVITGEVEWVDSSLACIRVSPGERHWVPLLQVTLVNGEEPTTLGLLERPEVAGVKVVEVG
jgi:hypothetical protein